MKEEEKIIERYGRKGPWGTPDGYFDSVRVEVMDRLPDYPAAPQPVRLSRWQRLKPYAYLAAMFAGIWCMMQVVRHASGSAPLDLDNPPARIAALMSEPDVNEIYYLPSAESDAELLDEVSSEYTSMDDFRKDFGVEIEPQYENMEP